MLTSEIGKTNHGFTLIELLVVLILIGVSSSYLMLNTNLLRIFDAPNEAPEQILRNMSDESILKGRTLHWFLAKNEERIYMDEYFNEELLLESNDMRFIDTIPSGTEVFIKTAQGIDYRIDENITPTPMLSFYPSGGTSGAMITIDNSYGIYKIIVRTNGQIEKVEE